MSKKPKDIETIAAEEIELDVERKDEKLALLDDHVAKEFGFVSRKYRIYFYRWLDLLVPKLSRRTGVELHGSDHNSEFLTHRKVAALLGSTENELELNSLWKKGRRVIRDRVREENRAERDRTTVIPITASLRDKDRFKSFKDGLDYDATNKDALIELLNLSETFESEIKKRVREEHEELLEENKELKKAKEGKFAKQQTRERIERLEDALNILFGASFDMSVDEYLKHHRQLQLLEEGHKRIAAENSSLTKDDDTEKRE